MNAQRQQVLATSVQVIAYARPRTLETTLDVPSRQLVPGNVVNPVPTCLQQSTAIPPELREIVALLSDAPANWFPPVANARQRARPAERTGGSRNRRPGKSRDGIAAPAESLVGARNAERLWTGHCQRLFGEPASVPGFPDATVVVPAVGAFDPELERPSRHANEYHGHRRSHGIRGRSHGDCELHGAHRCASRKRRNLRLYASERGAAGRPARVGRVPLRFRGSPSNFETWPCFRTGIRSRTSTVSRCNCWSIGYSRKSIPPTRQQQVT